VSLSKKAALLENIFSLAAFSLRKERRIGCFSSISMARLIQNFDAHQRVFISLAVAVGVFLLTLGLHRLPLQLILSWNGFAISVILLSWIRIVFADAKSAVLTARLQDTGRTVIFCLVLGGACASLFAVAFLLGTAKGTGGARLGEHVGLAALTVVCSWFLIHTVFTMHYTHAYYRSEDPDEHGNHGAGLDFPGEGDDEPDFLDFAYFAFVIGMTFQVSDVCITSKLIRRLSLVHALLSFLFNTVILALAINLASSLVGN
jgi:uncharacterized membrane protein